jgi:hypothetical protein
LAAALGHLSAFSLTFSQANLSPLVVGIKVLSKSKKIAVIFEEVIFERLTLPAIFSLLRQSSDVTRLNSQSRRGIERRRVDQGPFEISFPWHGDGAAHGCANTLSLETIFLFSQCQTTLALGLGILLGNNCMHAVAFAPRKPLVT